MVCEDLALAARLRQAGYRGYYAHHIHCLEAAPPSYESFRRRNRRVARGTLQFLWQVAPDFLRSSRPTRVEKIDLLLSTSLVFLPIPFVCFLLFVGCLVPLLEGAVGLFDKGPSPVWGGVLHGLFNGHGSDWDIVLLGIFVVFAPLIYLLPSAVRAPARTLSYLLSAGAIYLSASFDPLVSALDWVRSGKDEFVPTGDRSAASGRPNCVELAVGLLLTVVAMVAGSYWLLAFSTSLIVVWVLVRYEIRSFLGSACLVVPVLITLLAICVTPETFFIAGGMLAGVAFAHH